jgi:hypothetical protein
MAGFLNLRDDGRIALRPRERNLCGQTMPSTAMSGCATIRAGLVPGSRRGARRIASFRAVDNTILSEILIGCAAIRNRCKSLKVQGGDHF